MRWEFISPKREGLAVYHEGRHRKEAGSIIPHFRKKLARGESLVRSWKRQKPARRGGEKPHRVSGSWSRDWKRGEAEAENGGGGESRVLAAGRRVCFSEDLGLCPTGGGGGGVGGPSVGGVISGLQPCWRVVGETGDRSSLLAWLSLRCLWTNQVEVSSRSLAVWPGAEGPRLDRRH